MTPYLLQSAVIPHGPTLMCFPFLGGAHWDFLFLKTPLPHTQQWVWELPNRFHHPNQNHNPRAQGYVAAMAQWIAQHRPSRPLGFVGWSMGAHVAYHTALCLKDKFGIYVDFLYVVSSLDPDSFVGHDVGGYRRASDGELVERFHLEQRAREWGLGVGNLGKILKMIRFDYEVFFQLQNCVAKPISTPIVGVWGTQDPLFEAHLAHGWSQVTTGGFRPVFVDDGHFFTVPSKQALAHHIGATLKSSGYNFIDHCVNTRESIAEKPGSTGP